MTKDSFSPSRCALLARLYITENKRFFLLALAGILGILVFLACAYSLKADYNISTPDYPNLDRAMLRLVPMYIVTGYILGVLGCSNIFSTLKNKQGRINLLMIPANASEKLISRVVLYMIVFPVAFIVLVGVAESLRCLMVSCMEHVIEPMPLYVGVFKPEIRDIILPKWHPFGIVTLISGGFFAAESLFILGSVIWHKTSALKTFVVFSALAICYIASAVWLADKLTQGLTYIRQSWLEEHCAEFFICLEIAAIVFNLAMAWLRLREQDVITTRR